MENTYPAVRSGKFRRCLQRYFELILLVPFLLVWAVFVCRTDFSYPIVYPSFQNSVFFGLHYIFPLAFAFLVQFVVLLIYKIFEWHSKGITLRESLISLLYIPYIALVIFLHFNFKSWIPLVNSRSYDSLFHAIDQMTPIANWLYAVGKSIDIKGNFDFFYFFIFFMMFVMSYTFHAMFDSFQNLRKVVVGTCLVLLLGGLSYWIAPAVGPFVFHGNQLAEFLGSENAAYVQYVKILNTQMIPANYFGVALASMPSLHVANSLFFLLSAWRSLRWLAYIYIPIFMFIVIVAIASGYHYLIDLVFGAILSLLVFWIVNKVYG